MLLFIRKTFLNGYYTDISTIKMYLYFDWGIIWLILKKLTKSTNKQQGTHKKKRNLWAKFKDVWTVVKFEIGWPDYKVDICLYSYLEIL